MKRALWVAMLAGCGASTVPPGGNPDCDPAGARAGSAWANVADLSRPSGDEAPLEGTPIGAAVARLEAHIASLRESPTEIDGAVAMEISAAVMDALDELGPDVPPSLRARCDDAAEALLTDRSATGSTRAARGAVAALEGALGATHAEAAANRIAARALARLARRAQGAAEGYAEDVRIGDQRADRAEAATLPDDAPGELVEARAEAIEASRAAREVCAFARTLSAPSI